MYLRINPCHLFYVKICRACSLPLFFSNGGRLKRLQRFRLTMQSSFFLEKMQMLWVNGKLKWFKQSKKLEAQKTWAFWINIWIFGCRWTVSSSASAYTTGVQQSVSEYWGTWPLPDNTAFRSLRQLPHCYQRSRETWTPVGVGCLI